MRYSTSCPESREKMAGNQQEEDKDREWWGKPKLWSFEFEEEDDIRHSGGCGWWVWMKEAGRSTCKRKSDSNYTLN